MCLFVVCGFSYHRKCLGYVDRICSSSSSRNHLDDSHTYIFEVCPERGLTHQHFRCARCNVALNSTATATRLCDYCGQYFCPSCHHHEEAVIPARVIHNWDFNPRKVRRYRTNGGGVMVNRWIELVVVE